MQGISAFEFATLDSGHFHVLNEDTLVPNDLDTGDIILFSRPCEGMNIVGAVLCYAAKVQKSAGGSFASSSRPGTMCV